MRQAVDTVCGFDRVQGTDISHASAQTNSKEKPRSDHHEVFKKSDIVIRHDNRTQLSTCVQFTLITNHDKAEIASLPP